jgi:hypothetical protein
VAQKWLEEPFVVEPSVQFGEVFGQVAEFRGQELVKKTALVRKRLAKSQHQTSPLQELACRRRTMVTKGIPPRTVIVWIL